jgi:exo-beta-1,3-glucanase (GH17 family)
MVFRSWPNKWAHVGWRSIFAISAAVVLTRFLYVPLRVPRPKPPLQAPQATLLRAAYVAQASNAAARTATALNTCLLANGLAYGPFRDGQGPSPSVPFPTLNQIEEDLASIGRITKHVRTYGSGGNYAQIAPLAKRHGISVMQGIHLGSDDKANKEEISAAVSLAHQGLVDSIVVGNETLSGSGNNTGAGTQRSRPTKQELISYIHQVKEKLGPDAIPVSTAQIYSDWESNLDLVKDVDFVVAHFYPFWDGQAIGGAAATVLENYGKLKADLRMRYGHDVRVVIGETGWPSGGSPHDAALPSSENQRKFFGEFITLACNNSIPFYYFEAFDEEWKWREGTKWEGSLSLPDGDRTFSARWIGSSWGIYQSNGRVKPQFTGVFDQPAPGSRASRDIFAEGPGLLSAYYDMGVDSDPDHRHDWLSADNGELTISYPSGQHWGAVFITVGAPAQPPRPWKDFSEFETLGIEMRGERGGERVEIGIKNRADPNTGNETRIIESLNKQYRPYNIPLRKFASGHLRIPEGLKQLNVVVELVFQDSKAEVVYARNIRYEALK